MNVPTFILILVLLFLAFVVIAIYSLFPTIIPVEEKKKMKFNTWIKNKWNQIPDDGVKVALGMLAITLIIFLLVTFISNNTWNQFIDGIHVELFGIFFDVLFLVLIFNWIIAIREKKKRIERYKEEIDDFRHWNSEEAKFRIRGIIRRLNKEKATKINCDSINIGNGLNVNNPQLAYREIQLDYSRFLTSNFSNLDLTESSFNHITDHDSSFQDSMLLRCQFKNSHLIRTNFTSAILNSANFENATLSGVNFQNCDLTNISFKNSEINLTNFDMCIVSNDFRNKLNEWNLPSNFLSDYTIVKTHTGTFVLRRNIPI